jgi:hypothetical protein
MSEVLLEPLASEYVENPRALNLLADSVYIFALSVEDRSRLPLDWVQRHPQTLFVELEPETATRSRFKWHADSESGEVRLRSESDLNSFLARLGKRPIYVDITGLPHFAWVPLLRAALRQQLDTRVTYSEPKYYVPGRNSADVELYELSDRISNAEPLPGFVSLARETEPPILIPLLGFEGGRFARVQQIVQTTGDRTYPVIGVPGFEAEYPFITYSANRLPLHYADCWMNVAFASANCPFALLARLESLEANRLPTSPTIKLALIGTKPHALGALLFFLRSTRDVELIYDHPVRSAGRTTGTTRTWVYDISSLTYRAERLTSVLL